MITLHGNPGSTCTRKVLMALEETKTPYQLDVLDFMKGDHKAPAHVARQPFGQMPALDDDDFHMYESRAMMRYIAEKAGSALEPKDLKTRATMEQWISIEMSNFTPHAMKYVYEMMGRKQDDATLTAAAAGLEKAVAIIAKQVEKQDFITGKEFSLADIAFMPYVEYAMNTAAKDIFAKYPAFMSWWGRVSERATWRKVTGKSN